MARPLNRSRPLKLRGRAIHLSVCNARLAQTCNPASYISRGCTHRISDDRSAVFSILPSNLLIMVEVVEPVNFEVSELQPIPPNIDAHSTNVGERLESTGGCSIKKKPDDHLRKIKKIALFFIGLCVLAGTVVSKVSLVSITGRMFDLISYHDGHTLPRSALFIQLTLLLVIPELVSFIRCLVWGVIGKTTESFPWPSKRGFILVSQRPVSKRAGPI